MLDIRARLRELGLSLPGVSPPRGVYAPAVRSGSQVYVSGQIPMAAGGRLLATGRVGESVTAEEAYGLSRRCALAALAAADLAAAPEPVTRVLKVVGYVSCAEGFLGQHAVVDGAGDLFLAVFGAAGRHVRSTVGVARLPLDVPVEIEVVFAVGD
ncbi:RidA family protein [Streptomyces tropicalis]|uniref:RidA family protein n=1 Tax=Streptomyces tropicalis TaxID=3034234 RepID=A0ABT6AA88_9ACTN|nr:RidA family protein [Streptomyces tropicalis]MDF3300740.1 RidA family protein [Streptomyces tropicalis]